jgi:catechol 2,3-dioxygenase-like lactoylglutathione lyase family enzyme
MVRFNCYEPRIPVADVRRTIEFYTQKLGFSEAPRWPADAPEYFTVLYRDQVRVSFTQSGQPAPCELHFEVDDVLGLYEALKDKSIDLWGPEVECDQDGKEVGWRLQVFDLDEHLVVFFQPTYREQ